MTTDAAGALGDGMSESAKDKGEAVKRRCRRVPTWERGQITASIACARARRWWTGIAG